MFAKMGISEAQKEKFEKPLLWMKIIIFSTIPTAVIYFSRSVSFLDTLQQRGDLGPQVNIAVIKDIILAIGLILQAWLLSYPLGSAQSEIIRMQKQARTNVEDLRRSNISIINKLENDFRIKAKQTEHLLRYYFKELFETVIAKMTNQPTVSLNIRLYMPFQLKNPSHSDDKYFKIKNVPVLAEAGNTNGLIFKVPDEGLVGECYGKKKIVLDDNLNNNLNAVSTRYNLTENQRNKTCKVAFCLCVPLFDTLGEVIAIVAYDSIHRIPVSNLKPDMLESLLIMVTEHSQFLYEYFPELFKLEEVDEFVCSI